MEQFNEYQNKIMTFMNPETIAKGKQDVLMNAVLGLGGEAGEVICLVKKWLYHGYELDTNKLDNEVGDVLFYCALYAEARDINLSSIAQLNVDKLSKRYSSGFSTEACKAKADENN